MRPVVIIGIGAVVAAGVFGVLAVRHGGGTVAGVGFDALLGNLPPGVVATHGDVRFDPVAGTAGVKALVFSRAGRVLFSADEARLTGIEGLASGAPTRIGHVSLSGVTVSTAPDNSKHIERIELDGLVPQTLRDVVSADAYPDGKPAFTAARPILASAEAFGITAHLPPPAGQKGKVRITGIDFSVAHAKATGLAARQLDAAPAADAMSDPAFGGDLARVISLASETTENVKIELQGLGTVTLPLVEEDGYDSGKLALFHLADLGFSGDQGSATLHDLTIKGLDFSVMLSQLPAILAAAQTHSAPPSLAGQMRVADFSASGFSADFKQAPKVTMDALISRSERGADGTDSQRAEMHNLAIGFTGRDVTPAVAKQLADFGMTDFTIDLQGRGESNPQAGVVRLLQDDVILHGLGTLHLTGSLDRYFPGTGTQEQMLNRLREARLIHASIGWEDASLTGRLIKISAQKSGRTEAEVKAKLEAPLAMLGRVLPGQPDAGDQVKNFLEGEHSITLELAPEQPVALGEIATAPGPQKASVMGLKITGN